MTRGFYEQLGVRPDADLDEIKAAYGRAVAHVLRRREATLAQGGDPGALDLARAQLDEAWSVLSDAARRRRYDAMLAVAGDGLPPGEPDDLWSRVSGAMIHPAVAAAARIVDVATSLKLGPLPEPPRPAGGRALSDVEEERVTATPRVLATFASDLGRPRPVARVVPPEEPPVERPTGVERATTGFGEVPTYTGTMGTVPGVRVGEATAPRVVVPRAPAEPARLSVPTTSAQDIEQLVDRIGYGGELLRTVREQLGISLEQMSETTRISARYLDAVEREDFGALPPAAAFVRGYVREMARILGLDVERVVAGYMRRFAADN